MNVESLKERTAKGLFWGAMTGGAQQLMGFVFGIVMARLLVPEYFGLVAMITVFSAVANALQNSGFSTALINEREQRAEDYNAVFWFNVGTGLLLYAVLWACAPLIARYYHEPRLVWLCRYAFLSFVFSSFGVAQAAHLYKNLRAKQLAKANIVGVLLSGIVAVVMAWQGFTYWAIATQTNLFILISTLLRWHYSEWRPTLPLSPPLRGEGKWRRADFGFIRRAFPFSVRILLSEILTQVNNNVMNILLGRFFGSASTGQYNQAYQWNQKGYSLVQNMVKQVDQAVLVSLSDERERQLAVLRKMVRFTAFVAFPLMLGIGLVAREFIVLALGEVWLTSASYLRLICVAGAVIPVSTLLSDLIISRGRSDIFLWSTLVLAVCQTSALVALHQYGIGTMVYAYVALTLAWLFVWHCFVRRLTGYSLLMLLKDLLPFALAAATVMVVTGWTTAMLVLPLRPLGPYASLWLLLAGRVVMAALLYFAVMRIAGARILEECMQFAKNKLKHS